MNEEQKKWERQYWDNIGITELFRAGCALSVLISLGIGLSASFHAAWLTIILFELLAILGGISRFWQPLYKIHRKILGNPNLPTEPKPIRRTKAPRPTTSQPIPWVFYVPAILMAIVSALLTWWVLYFMFKYFLK